MVMLRPDVRVARRDRRHLQVGVGAESVLVPDDPVRRDLLAALAEGRAEVAADDPTVEALAGAGLLVDPGVVTRLLPADVIGQARVLAEVARHGDRAARVLEARAGRGVAVRSDLPGGLDWGEQAARLLAQYGVPLVDDPAGAEVSLVLADREPDRDLLDDLVATGEPHLVLAVTAHGIRVGPFVQPGRTACQQCVDAHLGDRDGRRTLVLRQQRLAAAPWGLPEPADPGLVLLGLGWAARDLVNALDGVRPATWSATVEVGPDLDVRRRHWLRHPHCGCCWDEL